MRHKGVGGKKGVDGSLAQNMGRAVGIKQKDAAFFIVFYWSILIEPGLSTFSLFSIFSSPCIITIQQVFFLPEKRYLIRCRLFDFLFLFLFFFNRRRGGWVV